MQRLWCFLFHRHHAKFYEFRAAYRRTGNLVKAAKVIGYTERVQ